MVISTVRQCVTIAYSYSAPNRCMLVLRALRNWRYVVAIFLCAMAMFQGSDSRLMPVFAYHHRDGKHIGRAFFTYFVLSECKTVTESAGEHVKSLL